MANLLVTGAAGFIGYHVCREALSRGEQVFGIDNLNNAYDPRLKEWRLEQLRPHDNFHFARLDICDRQKLRRFLREADHFDAIVNLAARAGVRDSVLNPRVYYEANCLGTLELLEAAVEFGVEKFVLASTSSIYADSDIQPVDEGMSSDRLLSPYAASKKAAEELAYTFHYLHAVDISILRYFTVYGPAGRPDMSPLRFVQWIAEERPLIIFGDGSQSRDYTFVEDVARATLAAVRTLGFEIINIGADKPVVLLELVRHFEGLLGKSARLKFQRRDPSDVQSTWADISKARQLLDWQPSTLFEEGARALVEWYLVNREWAAGIKTI